MFRMNSTAKQAKKILEQLNKKEDVETKQQLIITIEEDGVKITGQASVRNMVDMVTALQSCIIENVKILEGNK